MKTQSEYQKISVERFMKKNNYRRVLLYVNPETKKRLESVAVEHGVREREVLNFIEMK